MALVQTVSEGAAKVSHNENQCQQAIIGIGGMSRPRVLGYAAGSFLVRR
jgi:hypothetical protein